MEHADKTRAPNLGISEREAIVRLEAPGSNHLRGFVEAESGKVFYDCFTERSDVTVTTTCIGDPRTMTTEGPNEVTGYRLFIAGGDRGLFLQTRSRSDVKDLHDIAVEEARFGGAARALARVRLAAGQRGIETLAIGIGPFRVGG